jgi:hypothetical protein
MRLTKSPVNRAEARERERARADAVRLLRRAIEIQEKSLGEDSPELGRTAAKYASVPRKLGRREEARAAQARPASIPFAPGSGPTVSLGQLQAESRAKRGR